MSGGSMNYLFDKVLSAEFAMSTPERRAFKAHLDKVAKALKAIEWVDSRDWGKGDETGPIRDCLDSAAVLTTLITEAYEARAALTRELNGLRGTPNV
jgi:hypothetical protein